MVLPLSNGLSDIKESPVKVAISWDDKDSMVYEINIPYSLFTKAPTVGDKISIGFVMRGMQMPEIGEGNRDGGGGERGGGMGGGGGFMMGGGGGMGGGGQLDFMKLFEENSFWIKYTLTTN